MPQNRQLPTLHRPSIIVTMREQDWPIKRLSIRGLYLDPMNPRLNSRRTAVSQSEIIAELIDNNDLMSLVKSISETGYLQGELILATKENNKTLILEGNRRVAALKLLRNPDLAPPSARIAAKKLSRAAGFTSDPKVPVMMAPDRQAVFRFLAARHMGEAVKGWTTANQARFIAEQKVPEESIDTFAARTSIPKADVRRMIYANTVHKLVLSLTLDDWAQLHVRSSSFPLSTLMRIFESGEGRRWLGIDKQDDGEIRFGSKYEDFELALEQIVYDLLQRPGEPRPRLDSRVINNEEGVRRYLSQHERIKPSLSRGRKATSGNILKKKSQERPSPPPRPALQKPQLTSILSKSVTCGYSDGRVAAIFAELKSVKLIRSPNTSAIMFRTLLDLALARYLEGSGHLALCVADLKKRQPKRQFARQYHPSLREMLDYFIKNDPPLSPHATKAVSRLLQRDAKTLSLDDLNDLVHDNYCPPNADGLRSIAESLEPMLNLILHPYRQESGGQ